MIKDVYTKTSDPDNHEKLTRMKRYSALRRKWSQHAVRIWSEQHKAFWRPAGRGYTSDPRQAWVLPFSEAYEHTKHCGREKRIRFKRLLFDDVHTTTEV